MLNLQVQHFGDRQRKHVFPGDESLLWKGTFVTKSSVKLANLTAIHSLPYLILVGLNCSHVGLYKGDINYALLDH